MEVLDIGCDVEHFTLCYYCELKKIYILSENFIYIELTPVSHGLTLVLQL